MYLKQLSRFAVTWLAAGTLVACTADSENNNNNNGSPDAGMNNTNNDGGTIVGDAGSGPVFAKSAKAMVRFKKATRLRNDIAQTLDLPANQVCNELGQYSCTDLVHTVALGGVEPYVLGLNEPLSKTTVTTPVAVERVVLAACTNRVTQDLADSSKAIIFKSLTVDQGKITNLDSAEVSSDIDTLYKRALLRPAKTREVEHLKGMYKEFEKDGQGSLARDWAILTCFSVLTTTEALFY